MRVINEYVASIRNVIQLTAQTHLMVFGVNEIPVSEWITANANSATHDTTSE